MIVVIRPMSYSLGNARVSISLVIVPGDQIIHWLVDHTNHKKGSADINQSH